MTSIPETVGPETSAFYSFIYELPGQGVTSANAQTLHIENTVDTNLLLCDVKVFGC